MQVKERKLSRFYAEYLLQTANTFDLNEFLTMWRAALPEGVKPETDDLTGISLVDKSAKPHTIRYFHERFLPENIQQRLETLFDLRERWTVDEIKPFVEKLTSPKLNVNALLTKYARGLTVAGTKYFLLQTWKIKKNKLIESDVCIILEFIGSDIKFLTVPFDMETNKSTIKFLDHGDLRPEGL